jgi:hypothetical protein
MPWRERSHKGEGPEAYPTEKARQGQIVLRKRWQRLVFIGGLALCVLLVIVLRLITGT